MLNFDSLPDELLLQILNDKNLNFADYVKLRVVNKRLNGFIDKNIIPVKAKDFILDYLAQPLDPTNQSSAKKSLLVIEHFLPHLTKNNHAEFMLLMERFLEVMICFAQSLNLLLSPPVVTDPRYFSHQNLDIFINKKHLTSFQEKKEDLKDTPKDLNKWLNDNIEKWEKSIEKSMKENAKNVKPLFFIVFSSLDESKKTLALLNQVLTAIKNTLQKNFINNKKRTIS